MIMSSREALCQQGEERPPDAAPFIPLASKEVCDGLFSINNVMVNIPLGEGGLRYRGLRLSVPYSACCIWCASRKKIINHLLA